MKQALMVNVVNPRVGGVLIRGEKGTAKSTAVRALAELLPAQATVGDCPYSCDPAAPCPACQERLARGEELPVEQRRVRVVELPVGATEDRLLGTLDLEAALATGEARFSPGILAAANRQILYVDEVNLLDDHLVDVLLDAAAMGVNTVERESVSMSHPAAFTLVGTMNPEEGELRPQLTDRFGLCVQVRGLADPASRQEVITRQLAWEAGPAEFAASWRKAGQELSQGISAARELLPKVQAGDEVLARVVAVSLGLGTDGHRGDLTLLKCALTMAALEGRDAVQIDDVNKAALLALPHRLRRRPLAEMEFDIADKIKRI
ncbi:MAG: AAA family ATPase [Desulfarculaceae bacterium]|nr:AAA family ATPase [Desulfarculaceae bacterium]MCF8071946.1 AAA family ATPase [Desulfarculaceae bacterium]MCF8101463.1 AAA family ATPase [Desulfarculaceae bacterium]MCF8115013.1 AAA family ATPase [Desulfarculaceae bacterium]